MQLKPHEQKRYDEYFEQLKGCEPHALAQELCMMLVFVPLIPQAKIIEQCRGNSAIIRRNRDNALVMRNKERYLQLLNKKRRTKPEQAELERLQTWFVKKLNIKEPA